LLPKKVDQALLFFFFPLRLIFIFSNKLNATLILDEISKVPRMFFKSFCLKKIGGNDFSTLITNSGQNLEKASNVGLFFFFKEG